MANVGVVDRAFWRGRRVFLTGHTGFKGSWLALWLQSLGAELTGFSLGVPTEPSLYRTARVSEGMSGEVDADICDPASVLDAVRHARPEVLIHMAAQPLVRRSFARPRETFEVNVMGTVNVLEAVRAADEVPVVVNVTSDKCYDNPESDRAFREDDPMGGRDPYSSSKGCSELVTEAYRRSFFAPGERTRLASARAGNVIGGGDWGEDRLMPDIMRAAIQGAALRIRNPEAIRPWQHVLNPLSGYLILAQALWESDRYARAWNFGPPEDEARPVRWLVERTCELWPGLAWEADAGPHPHEARYLRLDSSLAQRELGWRPLIGLEEGIDTTIAWFRACAEGEDMRAATLAQIPERIAA